MPSSFLAVISISESGSKSPEDGISKCSVPSRPSESASSSSGKVNGSTPMPTRFDLCILSKDVAMTALTPKKQGSLQLQSLLLPVPY